MQRNKYLDSAKFILVFLVVFIHTFEYSMFKDDVKLEVYIILSTFLMPSFIIISGYLSKAMNWKKYKRFFLQFTLIYLVFQYIYFSGDLLKGNADFMKLLTPIGPLWYIAGLLLWRFLVCIIVRFKIPAFLAISVSLVVSMLLGFEQDYIPVSRIFIFIPFFLIGYFCPTDFPAKIKQMNKIYAIVFFVVLTICVIQWKTIYQAFTVFGDYSYNRFESIQEGFVQRLIDFPLAILSSIAFYRLTPDTFHKLGTKTLAIFLLHILFVYPIYRVILHHFSLEMPIYVDFLVATVITVICILLSNLKIIQHTVDPILTYDAVIKYFSNRKK